jgi:hypothetical protein
MVKRVENLILIAREGNSMKKDILRSGMKTILKSKFLKKL